jgi:hypothetical protein
MKKWFLYICVTALLFFSCAGSPPAKNPKAANSQADVFWNTLPAGNQMVFIGVAGENIFNQQEAIDRALEDAARKIAFFYFVGGEVIHRENIGNGAFDYRVENKTTLDYDKEGYKKYIDALEFDADRDVRIENQAVFVRTRYADPGAPAVQYGYPAAGAKPGWIDSPPTEISGYLVGIGFAGPRLYHKDTVIASYENAVFALVHSLSSSVKSEITASQNSLDTFASYSAVTSSEAVSSGSVQGFYVLDTWTDPGTRAVWTLAVAKAASRPEALRPPEAPTQVLREEATAVEAIPEEAPAAPAETPAENTE